MKLAYPPSQNFLSVGKQDKKYFATADLRPHHKVLRNFLRMLSGGSEIISYIVVIFCFVLYPLSPLLADFNPNDLISDDEILNSSSMDQGAIQKFLVSQNSYLANYRIVAQDNRTMSCAEAIYDRAITNGVNPQVLLVLLQKEQTLITATNPSLSQLYWAVGYGCPDGSACDWRWQGLWKQIDSASQQLHDYMTNPGLYNYQAGQTYVFNDQISSGPITTIVTPKNTATAALYNYTPHVYRGNYNFWQLWQAWFLQVYPDGSILQAASDPRIWLIQNGLRRQFSSYTAFASRYSADKIIKTTSEALEHYNIGAPIKFADYSLLRSPKGTIYLINGDTKRGIVSMEVFRAIGFNLAEVTNATFDDLNSYADGEPITISSAYPTGALLQDSKTGGIYYVESGVKRPIWSRELLQANFKYRRVTVAKPGVLEKYTTGEPIKFKDGELVSLQGSPEIYVISDGQRRHIPSEEVFNRLGFKWDQVVKTNEKSLSLHPLGLPIEIGTNSFELMSE